MGMEITVTETIVSPRERIATEIIVLAPLATVSVESHLNRAIDVSCRCIRLGTVVIVLDNAHESLVGKLVIHTAMGNEFLQLLVRQVVMPRLGGIVGHGYKLVTPILTQGDVSLHAIFTQHLV